MTTKKWRWLSFVGGGLVLGALLAYAGNFCIESGPHYYPWSCFQSGGVKTAGTLNTTSITVRLGDPVVPPILATAPQFTNGLKSRLVWYDCTPEQNFNEVAPVYYSPGNLYFVATSSNFPPITGPFTNAGTYTYTAKVDATPLALAGWWPGEGNGNDIAFTNNGILTNGVTFGYGVVGRAFNFNGTSSYVLITNSPGVSPAAAFTVEAWINYDTLTGTAGSTIVSKGPDQDGAQDWALNVGPSQKLRPQLRLNGTWYTFDCSTVLNPGTWYHVAMVYDGNVLRGYVNGALDGAFGVGSGQVGVTASPMRIGAYAPVNGSANKRFFAGGIDEVSLYYCPLSAAQIQAVYNAGTAGKCWNGSSGSCVSPVADCVCSGITTNIGIVTITVASVPVFTNQPISVTTNVGSTVTFTSGASGSPSPKYQWMYNGASLAGQTNASLVLNNVQTTNAGNYWVVATNVGGMANSAVATLKVLAPPTITTQPQPTSQTVIQGNNASFSMAATGTAPLSYQWQFNTVNIFGANASSFTKFVAKLSDTGNYGAVVTNVAGSVTSSNASLTVIVPPYITQQPANVTANAGGSATFNVSVNTNSTLPLGYQWYFNGTNLLSGATTSSLLVTNLQATNAGLYSVIVSNAAGVVTSSGALLTVILPPGITTQPQALSVVQGNDAPFSVVATGTAPLSYQWYFNVTNVIAGATNSGFTKLVAQTSDQGNYSVVVTNFAGSVTSSVAALTVLVPPLITSQPTNLIVNLTNNATFNVTVSGSSAVPLQYQWLWNGNILPGATNASVTIGNVQTTNVGYYSVAVTNVAGAVTSSIASLTVTLLSSSITNTTALKINGDASYTNTSDGRVLSLTHAAQNQAGSAFSIVPISLVSNASFSTFFSFRLSQSGGILNAASDNRTGADGIVFLVQTLTNNVGANGGGMGYYGVTNSVGVEFDTWCNTNDPTIDPPLPPGQTNANGTILDGNHVGIDYNGFITNSITPFRTNGLWVTYRHVTNDMNDANIWYAWIDYDGTNMELRLSETNSTRPILPYLTNTVNILSYLHTNVAYLGFTAGTGGAYNEQDILTWQFISPYHPIGTTNPVPSVVITSPANNAVLPAGSAVALRATAVEQGGTITNVQFFNFATNLLGTAIAGANGNYSFAWSSPPGGSNSVTAVAKDNNGVSATSSAVAVIINSSPAVSAGPNITTNWAGVGTVSVTLNGSVTDDGWPLRTTNANWSVVSSNGTVTFGSLTQPVTTATFSTNGVYVLKLTGDDGFATNSATCTITVLSRPSIVITLPTNNTVISSNSLTAIQAGVIDATSVITNVLFFNGSTLLGTGTEIGTTTNYAMAWTTTNVVAGTNRLTGVATDNNGLSSTSAVVSVIINTAPSVSAGPNITTNWSGSGTVLVTLNGSVIDDGWPSRITNANWSVMSSNGTVTFGSLTQPVTTATFSTNGVYVLQLEGDDGVATNFATCTITVLTRPSVVITSPGNNAIFPVGALIGISATTVDVTGIITNVQMFNGASLIGNAVQLATNSYFLNWTNAPHGSNVLTAVATDNNGLTATSGTVVVIVNSSPVVTAGANQLITLPTSSVNLAGVVTDDGLPPGATLAWAWSVTASNGPVTFGNISVTNTTATFTTNGVYVLKLTANDGVSTNSATVTITVNRMPQVNAGTNQIINLLGSSVAANLNGSFSDDGLPVDATVSPRWTVVSATNGTVVIAKTNYPVTTATFTNSGGYVLKLTADDTVSTNSATVTIIVNRAPIASAGANQTLVWVEGGTSISTTLTGTITDDGYPFGTNAITWSEVSGPGTVIFSPNVGTTNATATFSTNGIYVLQLLISDGVLSSSSQCTVTVERRPTVAIISPTNSSTFAVGTTITNVATAFGVNASVTNVLFYDGTNLLGSGTPSIPVSGRVGWWRGEGNTYDSVSTNNGTAFNLGYTNGMVSQAFAFDPENFGSYVGIKIPDQPTFALTNSLSIEGWVRPRGAGYVIFWRGDQRPGLDPYTISMQGNSNVIFQISDQAGNAVAAGTNISYNQWSHIAGVLDGSSGALSFYLNGVLVGQTNTSIRPFGSLLAGNCPSLGIGNVADCNNNFPFRGDIDEIALYNRALSVGEVQSIYNSGTNNPFTFIWTNAPAGSNRLTAVAIDNNGLISTSAPVDIFVNGASLSIAITQPASNTVYEAPGVVSISATVSGSSSVHLVNFFANGVAIGQDAVDSANPYTFTWVGAAAGDYTLTAQAVDALNNTATSPGVTIHVAPPVNVNAGPNQVVVLTNSSVTVSLAGAVSGGFGTITSSWTQATGPAVAHFANASVTNTTITPTNIVGNYLLRLTAGDGLSQGSSTMMITVVSNLPPVVDPGPNRIIAPGGTAFLNGSVSDDGLPRPPHLSNWWSVVSGPTTGIVFTNVNSAVTVASNFPVLGIYTLRLSATDGLATTSSNMTVTVADPSSRTYTFDADFAEGELVNVNYDDIPNQLQLNHKITPFPFVWIACSHRGTIVRIDANTGQILGEFRTVPLPSALASSGEYGSPSRTTVDRYGNVWVANRCDVLGNTNGSITRIGLVIGGTRGYKTNDLGGTNFTFVADQNGHYLQPPFKYCTAIDRDGDGLIKTSSGLGDILEWDPDQTGTNTLGGVSAADDECIINYTRVPAAGVRTIAVDANNDVWIGAQSGNCAAFNQVHCKVDGVTGQVVPNTAFQAIGGGYGGLIDSHGILWSANSLIRFDINKRFDMSVNPPAVIDPSYIGENVTGNYGIGIDPITQFIWFTDFGGGGGRVNPADMSVTNFDFHGSSTRGIAVDGNGDVWVANSSSGDTTVSHLRNDGTFVGHVDLGCGNSGPHGVSIDANGKVWAACYDHGTAVRINPNQGPRVLNDVLNSAGYLLGAVDMVVNLDTPDQAANGGDGTTNLTQVSSFPYNYSDMSGYVSLGATEPFGLWSTVHDSGISNETWGIVQWDSSEPSGTGIRVEVRAANDSLQLQNTNNLFQRVTNNLPFNGLTGRYIQIRTTFVRKAQTNSTPVLFDLTVSSGTNAVIANVSNFANSDRATTVENGGRLVINVLTNDAAPAGSHLTITAVSAANSGYVTIGNGATNVTYTPNTNFFGVDRFTYSADDGHGGIGRAVVTVDVGQVLVIPTNNTYSPPVAVGTNLIVNENSPGVFIDVLDNDFDTNSPPLSNTNVFLVAVTQGAHGFVRMNSCGVYYTPNSDYIGPDSFTYTIRNSVGLRASAKVTLFVVGNQVISISCGSVTNGTLSGTNSALSTHDINTVVQVYNIVGDPSKTMVLHLDQNAYNNSLSLHLYDILGNHLADSWSLDNPIAYVPNTTNVYKLEVALNAGFQDPQNYTLTYACSNAVAQHFGIMFGTNNLPNGSSLDFGITSVGQPASAHLAITNFGTIDLTVYNASFRSGGGIFIISDNALTNSQIVVPAGTSSNLTVWFEALGAGQTNDVLVFSSDDPQFQSPQYQLNLTARANLTNSTPPLVGITNPLPNSTYVASQFWNSSLTINATSAPAAGGANIWGVNFYALPAGSNNVPIGQSLSPQDNSYSMDWNKMPPGSYQLTARAIDQQGLQSVSAAVPITILLRSTNSPHMEVLFYGTNNLPGESIVDFGITRPGSPVQAVLTITNLGPGPLTNCQFRTDGDPYDLTNMPSQGFSLAPGTSTNVTVVFQSGTFGKFPSHFYVDGNDEGLYGPFNGNQTIGEIRLNLTGAVTNTGIPPTVLITNPAPNTVFTGFADIPVQVLASTPSGASSLSVELYVVTTNGTIDLGSGWFDSGYYNFVWEPLGPGQYTFIAEATDSSGLATLSTPVPFTVVTRPASSPIMQVLLAQTNAILDYSTIDYGVTHVGTTVTASLTVSNGGNQTLVLTNYSLDSGFSLSNAPAFPITLPVHGKTNLFVRFDATTAGQRTSVFAITNNDVGGNPFVITNIGRANLLGSTPPTVSITAPTANSNYVATQIINYPGISISITSAPVSGSYIYEIDLYASSSAGNNILIEQQFFWDTPTFNWTGVPPGRYTLTAVATDDLGLQTVSAPLTITVSPRSTNSPAMEVLFFGTNNLTSQSLINFGVIPTNTIQQVTLTVTNLGPGNLTNETLNLPNGFYFTNSPQDGFVLAQGKATNLFLVFGPSSSGQYSGQFYFDTSDDGQYFNQLNQFGLNLTAVATNGVIPPSVSLTNPAPGSVFVVATNTSIQLGAQATAGDGAGIQEVDFYAAQSGQNVYLGNSGGPPYNFTWQNPLPGQYSLTAVAVGNQGERAISSPVAITVLLRPTNSAAIQVYLAQTNPVPNFSTIDYGVTRVGTPVVSFLTVSNAGNAPLVLSQFIMADTNDFTISNNFDLPVSIPVGSSTNMSIYYRANSPGQTNALLTIYNNDIASQPFYITNAARANPAGGTPPTVLLTVPIDGASYAYPANISLTAVASCASNSTLSAINFFAVTPTGNTQIGQVPAAPGQSNLIGTVSWSRPAPGTYSLEAIAVDNNGLMGQSTNHVIIQVIDPNAGATNVPYGPPVAHDDQLTIQGVVSNSVTYTIPVLANDSSPNNYPLTLTSYSYSGNLGQVTQNGNVLLFTPNSQWYGTNYVYYTITDGHGGTDAAWVKIIVLQAPLPTVTLLNPVDGQYVQLSTILSNRFLVLVASADGASSNTITSVSFYDWDQLIGTTTSAVSNDFYAYTWQMPAAGEHLITAIALDNVGDQNISSAADIQISGNPNNTPPVATITNLQTTTQKLQDGTASLVYPTITNGVISVLGKAHSTGAGDINSYQLLLYTSDGTLVANITPNAGPNGYYSGTDQNGVLASNLDLSLYENGIYDIVLNVFDGWVTASDSARILLNSDLKIGNFSFNIQDVQLPVSGTLPMTVTRTYNSLNLKNGEFGYSWTYVLSDMDVALDESRVDALDPSTVDDRFSLRVGGGRDVTLTLPDGRRVTFQFFFDGPDGYNYIAAWKSPPGVNYTLTAIGNPYYDSFNGFWDSEEGTGFDTFDFEGFVLTGPDNTKYVITREDQFEHFYGGSDDIDLDDSDLFAHTYGPPILTQIIEANNDVIQISGDKIDHYDSAGTLTRSIRFQRDGQNRVIGILDPNSGSNGLPVMKYAYDTNGNLVNAMKLTDRNANGGLGAYQVTTYQYTNTHFPHFITGIIDPRGVQVATTFYDSSGRVIATRDADGNLTQFINNPTNNTQIIIDRQGHTNTMVYDLRGNIIAATNAIGVVATMTYGDPDHPSMKTAVTNAFGTPQATWALFTYDANGFPATTVSMGHTNSTQYDNNGNLAVDTGPSGNVTMNFYDGAGNLTNIVQYDSHNNVIASTTSRYENGHMVEARDGNNRVVVNYGYDSAGNLTNSTDANNFTRGFTYDGNGNQTNSSYVWVNPNGGGSTNITTATLYDAAGRVTQLSDPLGHQAYTFYNAMGKVDYSVDKFGNTNSFQYDARGNLIQVTYPNGTFTRTVYDALGRGYLTTDRNALTGSRTDYDAAGRPTNEVRLLNVDVDVVADTNNPGQSMTVISAMGTVLSSVSTVYDAAGRVQSTTTPDGTSYNEYYPDGQLMRTIDPLNNTNFFEYDIEGRQTNVVDALNHSTKFQYDTQGRLAATVYDDNTAMTNIFNTLGQRIGVVDQAKVLTQFGYSVTGQLTNVVQAAVPDPENGGTPTPTWSYMYDNYGRLMATIDPKNRATTNFFDAFGRQISQRLPLTQTNFVVYNAIGQVATNYDFKNQRTEFRYDNFGRLTNKYFFAFNGTRPSNSVSYAFDQLGQLLRITQLYGADASNSYSVIGDRQDGNYIASAPAIVRVLASLTQSAPKWGGPVVVLVACCLFLTLVPSGRKLRQLLVEFYLRGGWRLENNWRRMPARLRRQLANQRSSAARLRLPSLFWRFASLVTLACVIISDPTWNRLSNVRADCVFPQNFSTLTTRITDFAYDAEGRVSRVNAPEGVINYGYDLATGRLTSTCTINSYMEYTYDALGRLKTVHVTKRNGSSVDETTTYFYDKVGNRSEVDLPNNVVTTYLYDNLNRLTNMMHKVGTTTNAIYSYKLDVTGRKTNAVEILRQEAGADSTYRTNTLVWRFDNLYRLTNEVSVSTSTSGAYAYTNAYRYDIAGNRLHKVRTGGGAETVDYGYDANDELKNETNGTAIWAYLYDKNGSLTNKSMGTTNWNYAYDLMNKLSAVTYNGTQLAAYQYNDQGIRVRTMGVNSTNYLVDANNHTGFQQVLEEFDATSGTPTLATSYVLGDDVLAQAAGSSQNASYLLYDGHGSTRQVASNAGVVTSRYNYDAYGNTQTAISSATPETSLLYCGEQYDATLQMYNLRARFYNPTTGRFNVRDSHSGNKYDPQTLHRYAFTANDPVNNVDPSGNEELVDVMVSTSIGEEMEAEYTEGIIDTLIDAVKMIREFEKAMFPLIPITAAQVPAFHKTLAHLCYDSYNPDKGAVGWLQWKPANVNALGLQNATWSTTDFFARLYSDGGSYALAYRGTNTSGLWDIVGDWYTNIMQGAFGPLVHTQYDLAVALAEQVDAAVGGRLTMTGHSLGGGLAAAAAFDTDHDCVTFNAAALNEMTWLYYGGFMYTSDMVNYSVDGEMLTTLQRAIWLAPPTTFCTQYQLPVGKNFAGANMLTLHGMDSVLDALGEKPK